MTLLIQLLETTIKLKSHSLAPEEKSHNCSFVFENDRTKMVMTFSVELRQQGRTEV